MVIRVFLQVILFMLNCFYTCTVIMLLHKLGSSLPTGMILPFLFIKFYLKTLHSYHI